MKKTNKIFSVILALALVFAMAIPAFAADDGVITIDNAIKDQTYTVYKMMSFTPVTGGDAESDNGFYAIESDWADFLAGEGAAYLKADENNGTIVWVGEKTDVRKAELAKLAVAYAKDNGITGVSQTATSDTVEFTGLAYGYYAIDTSLGTVCGLTNTNTDFTAHEKNTQPTIDKVVQEDSTQEWGKVNDAEIGDTVNFKITVNAKANSTNYIVHDTMEAGLTFDANSVAIAGLTKDTDYTVVTDCEVDGCDCTFAIVFDQDYLDTITANTDIVITYSAVLNKDAEIVTGTNDNTAKLTYGDNATSTEESKTQTLTYYFDLTKVDTEGNQLEGAEFTLSNAGGVMEFVEIDGGYRVATAEEIADDTITTTQKIVAGKVVIKGLDADTYTLTETKAPAGYNLLDEAIEVTVTKATVGDTITYEAAEETVVNKTGSLLPETGGMGTTILYIVGAILVVGAVVILISKKRMSAEA